jgi:hypothetical protein
VGIEGLFYREGREGTRRENPDLQTTRTGANQDKCFIGVHSRYSRINPFFALLRVPSRPSRLNDFQRISHDF